MKQKLLVSQIQNFSLHDGPGIRTTVFLQGCNLRCKWCHNPETWKKESILSYTENKCIGCGQCIEICPSGAQQIQNGQHIYERTLCTVCGKCVEICCTEALEIVGSYYSAEELSELLLRDRRLYEISEGGVTFSGGEPMMQAEILYDLCNRLQKEHISVAFETALAFPWKVIHRMTECADLFLVDFKMFDNEKHKEYTGTENTLIKENLKKLVNYRPIMIRLPIIKGINDEIENAVATADFFAALGRNIKSVEFLPYHDFGVEKANKATSSSYKDKTNDRKIVVSKDKEYYRASLNVSATSLKKGQTATATVLWDGMPMKNTGVVMKSSNTSVCTVKGGKITAVGAGTATIKMYFAGYENGASTRKITVTDPSVARLTFNPNGGTVTTKTKNVKVKAKAGTLPSPSRKGYTFTGWYTAKSGGTKVTAETKISKSQTLYAHWTKTTVSKAVISKLTNTAGQKLNVSVNTIKGVRGYQFIYAEKSDFSGYKTVNSAKTSVTLSNLKKNKTYYVKVRGFKKDSAGNYVYGTYSTVKKITVRK